MENFIPKCWGYCQFVLFLEEKCEELGHSLPLKVSLQETVFIIRYWLKLLCSFSITVNCK